MHLAPLIQDLAVILGTATLVSLLFKKLKQPIVLGYLLAGAILGPHTPPFSFVVDYPGITIWAELGVIFLMFTLGLEFSFRRLKNVGRTAAITGPIEVFFMLAVGYVAGKIAGLNKTDSIFLGAILSISSTSMIIKTLGEMNLKRKTFAQLIFGILIVEDLLGILIIVALSSFSRRSGISGPALAVSAFKLIVVVGSWMTIGTLTVPRLIQYIGKRFNDEVLLLCALALCLGLVTVSAYFHYSSALGAFIMGSIMAENEVTPRIERLVQPLRDLFTAIFFVSIGMLLNPAEAFQSWKMILALSLVTVIGKIFSTTLGALLTGNDLKTASQIGFGLAQIGEYSFIIAALGTTLGVLSPFLYSVTVAVSLITAFTTPYLIRLSNPAEKPVVKKAPHRRAS